MCEGFEEGRVWWDRRIEKGVQWERGSDIEDVVGLGRGQILFVIWF